MGESKRRKNLDPNYGKSKSRITVSEFGRKMYQTYGRGIICLHRTGAGYVLPSHLDVTDVDKELMEKVNFRDTFVVTLLQEGTLWVTGIFNASDAELRREVAAPSDWESDSAKFIYE